MRTIVIGDIHGCSSELDELLNKLNLTKDDAIYCVGDILDKSSTRNQIESLDLCLEYGIVSICGNHDDKYRRWVKHERIRMDTGKNNPMTSVSKKNLEVHSSSQIDR